MQLDYFDYSLKGKPNGAADVSPVHLCVWRHGPNERREEKDWSLSCTERRRYYPALQTIMYERGFASFLTLPVISMNPSVRSQRDWRASE
jgi:hypothetical protein